LNLDTNSIIKSHDIFWLNEAYYDWIERKISQKNENDDDNYDVIKNSKIQEFNDYQNKLNNAQDQDELKKKKVYKAIRWLESSFNPEASIILQNIEQRREILLEQANVAMFREIVTDEEPSTFDEA
jgi:hypothetical protein